MLNAACRWASGDLKHTAAASKFPTWLWYNLQLKLDLRPARNHCIDVGVVVCDSFDGERMLVSISRDGVFVPADDVLRVALPFHFGVGLLCLCFKDHRRAHGCFLGLRFLGKCWNYRLRLCLKTTRCSLSNLPDGWTWRLHKQSPEFLGFIEGNNRLEIYLCGSSRLESLQKMCDIRQRKRCRVPEALVCLLEW